MLLFFFKIQTSTLGFQFKCMRHVGSDSSACPMQVHMQVVIHLWEQEPFVCVHLVSKSHLSVCMSPCMLVICMSVCKFPCTSTDHRCVSQSQLVDQVWVKHLFAAMDSDQLRMQVRSAGSIEAGTGRRGLGADVAGSHGGF